MAEAVRWGKRGDQREDAQRRIIVKPLARGIERPAWRQIPTED